MADPHPIPTYPQFKNLAGLRFGHWTSVSYAGRRRGGPFWNCQCDCGVQRQVRSLSLTTGRSKSCGCVKPQIIVAHNFKSRTGERFGRWTVVSYAGRAGASSTQWNCRCDCGVERAVYAADLVTGSSQSCGCLRDEVSRLNGLSNTTHGLTKTRAYSIWGGMKERCENPQCESYPNYGGRGITICERWRHSFENFLADMGHPPRGQSIDRVDVNGPYAKGNCRWTTPKTQGRNRRYHRLVTYKGKTQCVTAWAEDLGIAAHLIYRRISGGWDEQTALETPAGQGAYRIHSRNRMLTYQGKSQHLVAWADEYGMSSKTLTNRLNRSKWSMEKALTTRVRGSS